MTHSWVIKSSASVSSVHKPIVPIRSANSQFKPAADIRSHKRSDNRNAFVIHNWRLTRAIFFAVAFVLLFVGFTLVRTSASTEHVPAAVGGELVISVESGDTLWDLAAAYKKDSMDTRQAVHSLAKRNDLSSSELRAGQSLIVPANILPKS